MAAFTLHISEFALEQVFEYEAYYTKISPELGEKFLEELYECLARIEGNPGLWQKVRGDIRRGIVTGFSYSVFYSLSQSEITVLTILHQASNPGKWPSTD